MSDSTSLGPGGEFDVIRELLHTWGPRAVGIGDDAAVLRPPRGDTLVVSVDSVVEGRHFRDGWFTERELGYRAVAAALSDLAAMAAQPIGVLVAIASPPEWRERLSAIASGMGDAVQLARTHIVGGNLTASSELSVTTTVLGSTFAPLLRSGAREGDHVYVTGRLGAPFAAIQRLEAGESPGEFRDRFAHPVPRIGEAQWLADHGATAGIDISDGLLGDLRHVASASGVSIEIDAEQVPHADGVSLDFALRGGEEYELIVSAAEPFDTADFEARFRIPLTRIGHVLHGFPGAVLVKGAAVAGAAGHDHFSK